MEKRSNSKANQRKSQAQSLGDAIKEMLRYYQLEGKFHETYIVAHWAELVGNTIASRTEKVYIKDKRLFLKLSSASLRKELMMSKQKLMDILNGKMGENIVDDVIFL